MFRTAIVLMLLLLFAPTVSYSATVIRSPTAVIQNTAGDFGPLNIIEKTIDQSGLIAGFTSGGSDFDTYINSNPTHRVDFDTEWNAPKGVLTSTIDYDLGAEYSITRLALWNEDKGGGIVSMTVHTSIDASFLTSENVGSFAPLDNAPDQNYPAEVFTLASTSARYVRLDVTGDPVGVGDFDLTMGEIAFETSAPTSPPPTGDIPEPTSFLVFAAFGIGLFVARRRARQRELIATC